MTMSPQDILKVTADLKYKIVKLQHVDIGLSNYREAIRDLLMVVMGLAAGLQALTEAVISLTPTHDAPSEGKEKSNG